MNETNTDTQHFIGFNHKKVSNIKINQFPRTTTQETNATCYHKQNTFNVITNLCIFFLFLRLVPSHCVGSILQTLYFILLDG
jgi:hypothetical protein